MGNLLQHIETNKRMGKKMLVVLLDPEKASRLNYPLATEGVDMLFVGGSTGNCSDRLLAHLKECTSLPLVLFPGQVTQLSSQADALLFLSVLSSSNPEMLVGRHLQVARKVKDLGIESIPMGYILIDGGIETSVTKASHSQPIPSEDIERIVDTAIMADLLGKRVVYLEAGSGAKQVVNPITIHRVSEVINLPLIVGGGIRTPQQMIDAYNAGADVVVIGNYFEQHPDEIVRFAQAKIAYNQGEGNKL